MSRPRFHHRRAGPPLRPRGGLRRVAGSLLFFGRLSLCFPCRMGLVFFLPDTLCKRRRRLRPRPRQRLSGKKEGPLGSRALEPPKEHRLPATRRIRGSPTPLGEPRFAAVAVGSARRQESKKLLLCRLSQSRTDSLTHSTHGHTDSLTHLTHGHTDSLHSRAH